MSTGGSGAPASHEKFRIGPGGRIPIHGGLVQSRTKSLQETKTPVDAKSEMISFGGGAPGPTPGSAEAVGVDPIGWAGWGWVTPLSQSAETGLFRARRSQLPVPIVWFPLFLISVPSNT